MNPEPLPFIPIVGGPRDNQEFYHGGNPRPGQVLRTLAPDSIYKGCYIMAHDLKSVQWSHQYGGKMALNTSIHATDLQVHPDLQAPDRENEEHIDDLAEAIGSKTKLPRVRVVAVEHCGHFVVDGHHTYFAYLKAGRKSVPCVVENNTWEYAQEIAAKSNQKHLGLKRSHATKRWSVTTLMKLHPDWSDQKIVKESGVSISLVRAVRPTVPEAKAAETRVGVDGVVKKVGGGRPTTKGKAAAAKEEGEYQKEYVAKFDMANFTDRIRWIRGGLDALHSLTNDKKKLLKATSELEQLFQTVKGWAASLAK